MEKGNTKVKIRQAIMVEGSEILPIGMIVEKDRIPPHLRRSEFLATPDEDLGRLDPRFEQDEKPIDFELHFDTT